MFNDLTVVRKFTPESIISTSSVQARDEVVAQAAAIETVSSERSYGFAAEALNLIQTHLSSAERIRKDTKQPIIDAGKAIDKAATDFCAPLEKEKARLKGLMGDFKLAEQRRIQEEARRQEEMARKAREEQERLDREKQEAEQREIEARRRLEETQTLAAAGFSTPDQKAEAERLEQEIAQSQERQFQAAQQAQAVSENLANNLAPVEAVKAAGTSAKVVRKFEVSNLDLVYGFRKDLVTLTPNARAINAMINAPGNEKLQIPGLVITEEADIRARGVR